MVTAAAFELDIPAELKEFFSIFTFMGDIFEGVTNFDCFLFHIGAFEVNRDFNTYFFKSVFVTVLPLIALLFYSPIFFLLMKVKQLSYASFFKWMTTAFVVVVFTLHPTLTKFLFGLFNCIEIDKGEFWLREKMDVQCWTGEHLKWALTIGGPSIMIWVFSVPAMLLIILKRNKAFLNSKYMLERYKMIYQGYKTDFYFWEYFNISRKVLLIVINVFFSTYS